MKIIKLILVSCLLMAVFYSTKAQTPPDSTANLKEVIDWTFAPLDTSQYLSTGLLMDKGLMDSSFFLYRGLATDTFFGSSSSWYQLYYSSYNAQVSGSPAMQPLDSVYTTAGAYIDSGYVPVMTLWYDYNYISPDAYDSGWIDTAAGQVFATGIGNPFLRDSVFMVATPIEFDYLYSDTIRFVLGNDLFFTNRAADIAYIKIKVNDRDWELVPSNGRYTLALSPMEKESWIGSGGYIDIEVDVDMFLYQGFHLWGKFTVKYKDVEVEFRYDGVENIVADTAIAGSSPAKGYVSMIFGKDASGNKHTCITKPLIIAEGIDFGTKENPTGCRNGRCGTLGLVDIMTGLHPEYRELINGPHLIEALVNKGYDIIYLDYEDGATYIEDNAMVLVKLIQHINQWKCSDEEIVVAGVSMGGQVAKYALSYMETNNIPHCVRTYVSFDSPHKGANIPMGMQYLAEYFKGNDADAKFNYVHKLQRPATREMLLGHVDSKGYKDSLFDSYQENLQFVGNYPKLTRNVAIINGSRMAQGMGFDPGDKILDWHWNAVVAKIDVDVYALCGFSFDYGAYTASGFVLSADAPLKKGKSYQVFECTPTDHVPGGYRKDVSGFGGQKYDKLFGIEIKVGTANALIQRECFIPAISGLDINTSNYFYDIEDNLEENKPNVLYPFQAYCAPDTNQKHVYLSYDISNPTDPQKSNIAWLVNELERTYVGIPTQFAGTYNFGDLLKDRLPGVQLDMGSVIQINGNYPSGNGSGNTPVPGSVMTVYKRGCNSIVDINNGSSFVIGDNNNGSSNNKGILYMTKGSTMNLHTGGTLVVHNGSKLVIEQGAELHISPGTTIRLEGENAVLEIHGKLVLEGGAVFSPYASIGNKTGYVHFIKPEGFTGSQIQAQGTSSFIILTGQDKHNLLLRVEGGELEIPHPNSNPNQYSTSFSVTNGLIEVGTNSSIKCGSDIEYTNVRTTGTANGVGLGLVLLGQANYSFTDVGFRDLNTGMQVLGEYSNRMELEDIFFRGCSYSGLFVHLSSVAVDNCKFYQNEHGIYIQYPTDDSEIKNSWFGYNTTGIHQVEGLQLSVEETIIMGGTTGIELSGDGGTLILNCAKFYSNTTGINAGENTITVMCPNPPNSLPSGGYNSFWKNGNSIHLQTAEIYMDDGKNNFIAEDNSAPYNFVTGLLPNNITSNIDANDNYWYPAVSGSDILAGNPDHYSIGNYSSGGGSHPTTLYFEGSLASSVFDYCYSDPSNTVWFVPESRVPAQDKDKKDNLHKIAVFPNPADNLIFVSEEFAADNHTEEKSSIRSVALFNIQGKLISNAIYTSGKWQIRNDNLAEGIYYLKIFTEQEVLVRQILIVK